MAGNSLLVAFMALFGYFVFIWASSGISGAGDQALEDQQDAIECSQLQVDLLI